MKLTPPLATARAFAFPSFQDVPPGFWPWPNFKPWEIACRGTGALLLDVAALDRLQRLRTAWGRPMVVNSGFRSHPYNARIGGAPASFHLQGRAFDIQTDPKDRAEFIAAALAAGFTGVGTYATFVHIDDGPPRRWGTT